MKKQTIKIELLQGDNSPLLFAIEMSADANLSEVSGTLAFRIMKLREKVAKYKMNLGGFSFSRKFDVKISVGGTSASGTEVLGLSSIKFGITLQANEASADRFHDFLNELVLAVLTGEDQIEGTFSELKDELCLN